MTSSSRDANLSNGMFTDKDYIEELGLDPALEGKPAINDAIRKVVYNQTVAQYMQEGIPEGTAHKMAKKAIR